MADILLPTKTHIPAARPELVHRLRLIEKLNQGLHRKLTLISAPAGFGKTTLAADWFGELLNGQSIGQAAQIELAWLGIDSSDNDLGNFLVYLIEAIRGTGHVPAAVGTSALEMLQSPQPPLAETILISLLSDLSSLPIKVLLVLDDFHLVAENSISQAVQFLVENAPQQLHLVILTREDPPLPLAKLRAGDQMTELRSADLRFREAEASQFLLEVMGLELDPGSVAALEERTEGWIAGLQMAALSLQNRTDQVGFIAGFSGTNRYILDYLLEEVLASQAPQVQQFLYATSILKRLSAPLCDAVLDSPGQSEVILADLERANLFLVPLDEDRTWYRYHHLFHDLLRARFEHERQDDWAETYHRRAGEWYQAQGFAYSAIYHASLVPDLAWIERLIAENYMELFQRRDSASIRNWTGVLPKELILQSPSLSIHQANSSAWLGKLVEAEIYLCEAENILQQAAARPETKALLGHLSYVKGRVAGMQGKYSEAIRLCQTAREYTAPENQALLGGIGVMLGYGYFLAGDFENAILSLKETIRDGVAAEAINTTIGAYCVLARLYALQGQLQTAHNLYQEAERFLQRSDGSHRGAMSIVDVGLAEIYYERNDLDAAQQHLKRGLEAIALWSKADDTALASLLQARIRMALGDQAGVEDSVRRARQVIDASGVFSESRNAAAAAVVRFDLVREDSLAVSRWMNTSEKSLTSPDSFGFENELLQLTLARVYLSQQNSHLAQDLLSRLAESAQLGGRFGRLIEILILQSQAHQLAGNTRSAQEALGRGLELAESSNYLRTFIDEGPALGIVLNEWLAVNVGHPRNNYARHLLSQLTAERLPPEQVAGSALPNRALLENLSQREMEVIRLLALGRTNKEVASELILSPGTVKAHTSNIYRKMDVSNRTEAVARARQLGLLS